MENELYTCENCSEEVEVITEIDGTDLCESCVESKAVTCADCNCDTLIENATSVGTDSVCTSCIENYYTHCTDCNELILSDDTYQISWSTTVCQSCYENDYFYCNSCDCYYNNDYYAGDGYCRDCGRSYNDHIMDYSTNVLDYCQADKGSRLFGIELEVGCRLRDYDVSDLANATHEIVQKDAILKEDGSISTGGYDGFEIVTRPMTFENQVKFWTNFNEKRPAEMRSWELGTCGLHVHTTRKPLSALTIGKILVLINSAENRDFMTHIARRSNNTYARFKSKKLMDGYTGKNERERRENLYRLDRYEMVNLCNEKTIEFRMFRGSTRLETILCAVEFVDAVLDFVNQASIQELDYRDFTFFVMNESRWPNLKNRIDLFLTKQLGTAA